MFLAGITLLGRIHFVAIDFVVPPGQAEIGGDHVRAGMDVAVHALAGGDGFREGVLDGMSRFVFGNRGVRRGAESGVAVLRVARGMGGVDVVGIDHMTGGATAAAVVARMIVGARQRHYRIQQARFLQTEKYRIGAQFGAESAIAQLIVGPARIIFAIGIAEFGFFAPAAFKHAEDIAWLRDFPAVQRIQFGEDAFGARFFRKRRGIRFDGLRLAIAVVTFAEARVLRRVTAVVIEGGAPEHSGVRHHAGGDGAGLGGVASGGAAGLRRHAQISRIHEFYIFVGLFQPFRVGAFGKRGAILETGIAGLNVSFFFCGFVLG